MQRLIIALILLIIIAGCSDAPADSVATSSDSPTRTARPKPSNTPTFTPTATATATATSTATPTSTPTPTPTPTAQPLTVSGDARSVGLNSDLAEDNSACGVVDWLDFPLDPPDATNVASGGRDFGIYRGRYQSYHAGEDWWRYRGRSNFGTPVYSIGHGRVTYAASLGWGRDKGVVIVRHTFSDGRTILSFYGHLDPPSVDLRVGECVARGDKVGNIGDPRTPPHLHFEIRTHLPNEPGSGYWSEDPTLAGWLPPSQNIWESRIVASPGVLWTRPPTDEAARGLGILDGDTYAVMEDQQLIGISIADGSQRWNIPSPTMVNEALFDATHPLFYIANLMGHVEAYQLPQDGDTADDTTGEMISEPLWSLDLDGFGFPILMPLPGEGVVLARSNSLAAISPEGEILWQADSVPRPFDWTVTGDRLVFSTIGGGDRSVWTIDDSGLEPWENGIGGHLASMDDQLWLYDAEGIFRLDPSSLAAELVYELPQGLLGWGDILALPDGGALVAHRDRHDRRLIVLDPDGNVRWQRSYEGQVDGDIDLIVLGDSVFLVAQSEVNSLGEISIYALDLEEAALTHIFTGGTRSSIQEYTQALPAGDDRLLINIGGGNMALLDTETALGAISSAPRAR